MFDNLGKKTGDKPCNTIDTLIGAKTEIKGDISFSGGLRIDGKIKGDVTANGDGHSMLVMSEHAVVAGNVTVPHMIVNGTIKGNVRCSERIELQSKADISGDLTYKTVAIEPGAVLNGNLVREPERGAVVTRLKSAETGTPRRDGD